MKHDEIEELLGAYALDAVEPAEATEVENHLAICARCRAEVQEHREVAGLLAHTGADAPARVWDRIAGVLEGEEEPPRLATERAVAPARPVVVPMRRRPALQTLAGAVAASLILVLGVQVVRQDRRLDQMEEVAAQDPTRRAFELAKADPDNRVVELRNESGVIATAVLAEDGEAWLDASELPELDPSRTYQLWGDAGEVLVSLAVLGPDPDVVRFDARGYAALAVTAEQAPGVVISEQAPVAAGAVTA